MDQPQLSFQLQTRQQHIQLIQPIITSSFTHLQNNEQHSEQQSQPSTITPQTIQQLYTSRARLQQFANLLIQHKISYHIREDVLKHCDCTFTNKKQNFSYQRIEKLIKSRIEKMIKNKRVKRNWGNEDVSILLWVISKYCDMNKVRSVEKDLSMEDWGSISAMIPGSKPEGCMFKWLSLKRNRLADHNWSDKQSLILDKLVKYEYINCRKYGENDWNVISQKLYFTNTSSNKIYRCPKQCRQHWNCYLNPKLKKGPWSVLEDIVLLSEVKKRNGQKRWTEFVKNFDGRTQNALKNRYNLIIQKQKKMHMNNNQISELQIVEFFLKRNKNNFSQNMEIKQQNYEIISKIDKNQQFIIKVKQPKSKTQQKLQKQPKQHRILRKRISKPNAQKTLQQSKINTLQQNTPNKALRLEQQQSHFNLYSPKISQNHIIQLNDLQGTSNNSQILRLNLQTQLNSPYKIPILDTNSQIKNHGILELGFHTCSQQNLQSNPYLPSCLNNNNNIHINSVSSSNNISISNNNKIQQIPDFQHVKIITIKQDEDIKKLKQMIKQKQCSFVPYKFTQNTFTKIKY